LIRRVSLMSAVCEVFCLLSRRNPTDDGYYLCYAVIRISRFMFRLIGGLVFWNGKTPCCFAGFRRALESILVIKVQPAMG